jgi:hypothetical protein
MWVIQAKTAKIMIAMLIIAMLVAQYPTFAINVMQGGVVRIVI